MTRADACVPFLHGHTRRCNAAGYANGRADALAEIKALIEKSAHDHAYFGTLCECCDAVDKILAQLDEALDG